MKTSFGLVAKRYFFLESYVFTARLACADVMDAGLVTGAAVTYLPLIVLRVGVFEWLAVFVMAPR